MTGMDEAMQAAIEAVDRRWWTGDGAENRRLLEITQAAVDAARPIIEAEALTKAADVISADEFTADDPTSYDPDYWSGIIEAASYLRRVAARTEPSS